MPRQKSTTKRARNKPQQKSLLNFFETSSPLRGQAESGPSGPTKSPTRIGGKAKGKMPAKGSRGAYRLQSDEDDSEGDGSTSSDVGAIGFEPEVITVSSSSEEDAILPSPRKSARSQRKIKKRRADSEERDSAVAESDSDGPEHIGVPVIWRKAGTVTVDKRKRAVIQDSDDDELQPRRRKLVKGIRPPTPEEENLLDELDSDSRPLPFAMCD